MPPNIPRKHDAEELIIDTAVNRLRSRIDVAGSELEVVNEVLRGDADSMPSPPLIWLGDGEVRLSSGTSMTDMLQMDLGIQADVKSLSAEEGSKEARRLSSLAAEQLMIGDAGERDLRLGLTNFVTNVEFYRSERGPAVDQTIYTHITVVRVSFRATR